MPGPTPATIEHVIDGDTVKLRVGVWIDQELVVSAHLADIDAPELFRPKRVTEKARAERRMVRRLSPVGAAARCGRRQR